VVDAVHRPQTVALAQFGKIYKEGTLDREKFDNLGNFTDKLKDNVTQVADCRLVTDRVKRFVPAAARVQNFVRPDRRYKILPPRKNRKHADRTGRRKVERWQFGEECSDQFKANA
jgi:hypothetical protein